MAEDKNFNWHTAPGMSGQYMGEWNLPEKSDMVLTISKIGIERVVNGSNGSTQEKIVCHFEGEGDNPDVKPMIMNKTNLKACEKAFGGDPYINHWPGHRLQLYRDQISVANKGLVKCIRVRDFEPTV